MVSRRRERGQLVLIAAILVATAILGAVILLNAVHSSPDVKAQTDAQSLSDAERTVDGIQQDLRQVFFATSPVNGSHQPFAESVPVLAENVSAYNDELGMLVSTDGAAVPSVELDRGDSVNGTLVFGDVPTSNATVIGNANSIPSLSVNASTAAEPRITIVRGTEPDREIRLDGSNTEYDDRNGVRRECNEISGRATLELTRGSGTIYGDNGAACEISVYDPSEAATYDVAIDASNDDGRFVLSGSTPAIANITFSNRSGVVNPAFDITHLAPGVTYEGNFTLFGGGNR